MAYRRGGLRQKPWNKVQRREKFWIPHFQIRTSDENVVLSTTGAPTYVVFWDPFVEATEQTAAFNFQARGLSRQKLHRVQGHLKAHAVWNNLMPSTAPFPAPLALLDYVWMVVDKAADTHDAGSFPATSLNPSAYSSGDLFELLQRDDILKWGTVEVPRINSQMEVLSGYTTTDTGGQLMRGRASIPFPRIGKMGLDIQRGKALACIVAARALVDGNNGLSIDDGLEALALTVVIEPIYRFLVS